MKRSLLIVAVFLLAGAVVNVAVAVVGAAFETPSRFNEQSPTDMQKVWSRYAPADWPEANFSFRNEGTTWVHRGVSHEDASVSLGVIQWRAGWPLRSLVGTLVERGDATGGGLVSEHTLWPFGRRLIPHGPIWPGFAINTILYATILWLLICGPFALRRFIRVKRGLCPACAYPRGESPVCPECGKALPTSRASRHIIV